MSDGNPLLKSLVKKTLGRTSLPEDLSKWGLNERVANKIGSPSRNLLYTAGAPISDNVHEVCRTLFRETLNGGNAVRDPLQCSTGLAAFIQDDLNIEDNRLQLLAVKPSLDYPQQSVAIRLNLACYGAIIDWLHAEEKPDIANIAKDITAILDQATSRCEQARGRIPNEVHAYGRRFVQTLHLERGQKNKASLKDVYIEPPFAILAPNGRELSPSCGLERFIESFVDDRLDEYGDLDSPCNALTILGQAGSGKTSLIQSLAARYLEGLFLSDRTLFIVTLRELASTGFTDTQHPIKWLESKLADEAGGLRDSLMILDGLDELSLILSAGETIDDFYQKLLDDAVSFNGKIVITSRPNYIKPVFDKCRNAWQTIEIGNLACDAAMKMAEKLGKARKEEVPKEVVESIRKAWEDYGFLGIPLLLYTALALGIDVSQVNGKCGMYDRIFDQMSHKAYSECGKSNFASVIDPRKIARALAAEMRRKGRKYLDAKESKLVIERLADDLADKEKRAILENGYGMTFFYKSGASEEFAPEFLHQTFMEYLAAEEIYSTVSKRALEGNEAASQEWWEEFDYLLSGAQLSAQTVSFYCHLAKANEANISINDLTSTMLRWLTEIYAPAGMLKTVSEDQGALEKCATLFVNYWRLVKAPNQCRPLLVTLDWRHRKTFFDTLRVVSHVRNRNWIDLSNEKLGKADLSYIDFTGCRLRGCDLKGANLTGCNFAKADLKGTGMSYASIKKSSVDCTYSKFVDCGKSYAKTKGASESRQGNEQSRTSRKKA